MFLHSSLRATGSREKKHNGIRRLAAESHVAAAFLPIAYYPILKQAGLKMSRYLVIIEQTSTGLSAYSPDLPGCVATGATREEVEKEMHDAIEFHLEALRLEGEPVPVPRSEATDGCS
jgi:predicted RNase H-like HicB family nuclease